MKLDETKRFKPNKKSYLTIVIVALVIILLYFSIQRNYFGKMLAVLEPIIIGVVIAYLLNPLVKVLEKSFNKLFSKMIKKDRARRNLSRGISIGISLIALIALFTAIVSMIVPQILTSINGLIADLPSMVTDATAYYNSLVAKYDLPNRINEFTAWYSETFGTGESQFDLSTVLTGLFSSLQASIIKSIGTVGSGLVSAFTTLFNIIIGLIVTVYLLAFKENMFGQFKKAMYAFVDRDRVDTLIENSRECNLIVTNFIVGKIIASLIVGVLCFIFMLIFRIPYVLLISVIIGLTDIIPFFGPYIGTIPSALLILLNDPIKAVYFVIMIIVIQQVESNLISPKIIGDSIGLSPFWVMFAMIFGGGMFGLVGMLLGVPILAIIFFILRNVSNRRLKDKNMPISGEVYAAAGAVDPLDEDADIS